MTLLLITETAIIEHIFKLICGKLKIELTVERNNSVSKKYDLIIIDQNFIDNRFNIIKQFSRKLGAITPEELPFDKSRDFIIPRPFLPSKLFELIQEQIEIMAEDEIQEKIRLERIERLNQTVNDDLYIEDDEVTIPVTSFLDSLSEDKKSFELDESLINIAKLNDGGVLDSIELKKINGMLRENELQDVVHLDDDEWKNISQIIDEALDEVRDFDFTKDVSTYNLVLSNYSIEELKPLLEKFDQTIIDKLSNGEAVDVRISLRG